MTTRTHGIQVMTEDGAYMLCYTSEASAVKAFDSLRSVVMSEFTWVELQDDEAMRLFIRVDGLHSVAFSPLPNSDPPLTATIFNLNKETKVN